ncbi:MAG: hypothetical protein EPO22_04855 [Dehalococcoidia bacterium]|nr:MAG: hypothetical protein EPO22_04855 [Dehalococcoidia bacterium]
MSRLWLAALALAVVIAAAVSCAEVAEGRRPAHPAVAASSQADPALPLRAAFYYPWFPQAWTQQSTYPYTNYNPVLGFYDSGSPAVIANHIAAMQYGNIQAGIASWWGQGHHTDQRVPALLAAAAGTGFKWSLYYEPEGQGLTTVAQITSDLRYIQANYASDASYLKIGGKFVVFVYGDPSDNCDTATRWKDANTVGAYVVLKVFAGYRDCINQPDGWHQYAPAVAADHQGSYAYTISPGFDKIGEPAPRLTRDPARWRQNIRDMIASGAAFQLVTTFNEWGEGTAVEDAREWDSPSGYGIYLDALHDNGAEPPAATPTPTAQSVGGSAALPHLPPSDGGDAAPLAAIVVALAAAVIAVGLAGLAIARRRRAR